jgi:predicted DNA-binding antitoxin AbrB/MazE fold protein
MITNVSAIFVDGVIKPTTPLEVPEGTALEIDIRVKKPKTPEERAEAVKKLAEAFKRISFRSGQERFNREDLYDRD